MWFFYDSSVTNLKCLGNLSCTSALQRVFHASTQLTTLGGEETMLNAEPVRWISSPIAQLTQPQDTSQLFTDHDRLLRDENVNAYYQDFKAVIIVMNSLTNAFELSISTNAVIDMYIGR